MRPHDLRAVADKADVTTITKPSTPCPHCSGKGWLPLRLDSLPVAGWIEMLCRDCAGSGTTPQAKAA
jgi:DnaJ-class molecular chaperone